MTNDNGGSSGGSFKVDETALDQPPQDLEAEEVKQMNKNPILNKRILLEDDNHVIDKTASTGTGITTVPAAVGITQTTAHTHSIVNEQRMLKFDNKEIIKNLEKFDDDLTNDLEINNLDTRNEDDEHDVGGGGGGFGDDIGDGRSPVINENSKNLPVNDQQQQQQKRIAGAIVAKTNNQNLNKEGRIVVFGDSNCLDSTHIEKPCYWLLDALLEYTMTGHISNLLKDLNKIKKIKLPLSNYDTQLPSRLSGSNLYQYSKVLDQQNPQKKQQISKCSTFIWEQPISLNLTAPQDLRQQNERIHNMIDGLTNGGGGGNAGGIHINNSEDGENNSNLLRKLESQKGEVCSGCGLFLFYLF